MACASTTRGGLPLGRAAGPAVFDGHGVWSGRCCWQQVLDQVLHGNWCLLGFTASDSLRLGAGLLALHAPCRQQPCTPPAPCPLCSTKNDPYAAGEPAENWRPTAVLRTSLGHGAWVLAGGRVGGRVCEARTRLQSGHAADETQSCAPARHTPLQPPGSPFDTPPPPQSRACAPRARGSPTH